MSFSEIHLECYDVVGDYVLIHLLVQVSLPHLKQCCNHDLGERERESGSVEEMRPSSKGEFCKVSAP